MKNKDFQTHPVSARWWANRVLIVSLVGIGYFTLFPFHFDFASRSGIRGSVFLLGSSDMTKPNWEFFLNVLLFIPFGFAIAAECRKRGLRRSFWLPLSMATGAIVSYLVEILQLYIPTRNSGWNDVVSNTIGSVAGFILFAVCGEAILRQLSKREVALENWLTPFRTAALLLVFFGICFGVSIPLQRQTRLSNWDQQSVLLVGNDAMGDHPWRGRVLRLQIWDRALAEKSIYRLMSGAAAPPADSSVAASYDFTTPPPFPDQRGSLPALSPFFARPQRGIELPFAMDGTNWLTTRVAVPELTREIQKNNQFTIHLVCAPAGIRNVDERIVSLSQSDDAVNLHLRQEGSNLVLWFHFPLTETRSDLAWFVPDVFQEGQLRDIVATFNGADASIYVNGKKANDNYQLGPGVSLIHLFFYVRTADLQGFVVMFEMLIFLPGGLLIGIAARKWRVWNDWGKLTLTLALLLPPVFLEFLLVWVSGRGLRPGNIYTSLFLGIAGALLINADFQVELS
jgi:glycopeptide antibiotics resistance protein